MSITLPIILTLLCSQAYLAFILMFYPSKVQTWVDAAIKEKKYRDAKAKATREVAIKFGRVTRKSIKIIK